MFDPQTVPDDPMSSITLHSEMAELRRLETWLQEFFAANQLPKSDVLTVFLVLEEVVSNIIVHGYDRAPGKEILVRLQLSEGNLRIEIEDRAKPFNPLEVPPLQLADSIQDQEAGGMGVHIVRNIVDQLDYRRDGDRNRLTLLKSTRIQDTSR